MFNIIGEVITPSYVSEKKVFFLFCFDVPEGNNEQERHYHFLPEYALAPKKAATRADIAIK